LTGATGASYPPAERRGPTDPENDRSGTAASPTVVGAGASVDGDVGGEGDLVVEGRLRGRVEVSGSVTVRSRAEVEADVVAGGTVRIETDARVRGDVRAPRVVIVDGAIFQGTVDTSGEAAPVAQDIQVPTGIDALRRRVTLREP
jgi:cytoskeletal protein CcmA (bactofilin family)